MPATSLPVLEQRLEACLLELEKTHLSRPSLPTALARAEAGRRVDKLYEQMVELQEHQPFLDAARCGRQAPTARGPY